MRPASVFSSLVLAFLLQHSFASVGADIVSIESTCKAAAALDRRVDYNFCVSSLHGSRGSDELDTWGLAKIAALLSVLKEYDVVFAIKGQLKKPNDPATELALYRCLKLYADMPLTDAYDRINQRHYDAGKRRLNQAINMSHNCMSALKKVGKPSLLRPTDEDMVELSVIALAITNLIK